jgi:hypothetical protein
MKKKKWVGIGKGKNKYLAVARAQRVSLNVRIDDEKFKQIENLRLNGTTRNRSDLVNELLSIGLNKLEKW